MFQKNNKKMPTVVIFGRTNVGKSTLFNKLIEKKQAIVSNIECTTRDSNINTVEWNGVEFRLVDAGGIMDADVSKILNQTKKERKNSLREKNSTIDRIVQNQALDFVVKSDLVLFLVDNKTGLLPQDEEIATYVKKNIKDKTIFVVNKVDSIMQSSNAADFYKLNLDDPVLISATTGAGTGDLLDVIVSRIDNKSVSNKNKDLDAISVCIVGKPNVGKSSLLNSLLDYKRVIVSDQAHTTREPQDTEIEYNDKNITLIDTAGISKRGQKTRGLEKFGIEKSLAALKKADIALLVVDIFNGITHQDAKLVEEIIKRRKSLIIIANKWDKIENRDTKEWKEYIYDKFPFIKWAPIQFVSALTGSKTNKVFDLILKINKEREMILSQSQCDKLLSYIVKKHLPSQAKGPNHPYIYKIVQVKSAPPKFIIKVRRKDTIHFSYLRFVQNRLRDRYGFTGTPINIEVVINNHGLVSDK